MSPNNNSGDGVNGEEEDLPLRPLAELEQDVSPEFIRSVRKKIYRRTAGGQVLAFSWNLPKLVFMELMSLIGGLFKGEGGKLW